MNSLAKSLPPPVNTSGVRKTRMKGTTIHQKSWYKAENESF